MSTDVNEVFMRYAVNNDVKIGIPLQTALHHNDQRNGNIFGKRCQQILRNTLVKICNRYS